MKCALGFYLSYESLLLRRKTGSAYFAAIRIPGRKGIHTGEAEGASLSTRCGMPRRLLETRVVERDGKEETLNPPRTLRPS